jgi:hypothetical protein
MGTACIAVCVILCALKGYMPSLYLHPISLHMVCSSGSCLCVTAGGCLLYLVIHLPSDFCMVGIVDTQAFLLITNLMHFFMYLFIYSFHLSTYFEQGARWRSWLRHYATNRQVAGSIPDGVTGIFQ